VQIWYNL